MLKYGRKQHGAVLFLALIVLVVLMLGGVALLRSVDSGVLLAGNMAMQRSAIRSSDAVAQAAMAWLNNPANNLGINGAGYQAAALLSPKSDSQTWVDYWTFLTSQVSPVSTGKDAAGNTSEYIIQRMCDGLGAAYSEGPPPVSCVNPPRGASTGSSMTAGFVELNRPTGTYYNILVRTTAERGLTTFLQVTVYR